VNNPELHSIFVSLYVLAFLAVAYVLSSWLLVNMSSKGYRDQISNILYTTNYAVINKHMARCKSTD
jgi:hypothetical protein